MDQVDQVIQAMLGHSVPYSGYAMMARGGWALHGHPEFREGWLKPDLYLTCTDPNLNRKCG